MPSPPAAATSAQKRRRYRALYRLEDALEAPMFILGLVWLYLLVRELTAGLTAAQDTLILGIWLAFLLEFALKTYLAPRTLQYVRRNWITVVALVIPAFRVLRLLRAIRVLRAVRVVNGARIVRALTSTKRVLSDVQEAQGAAPAPEMNIGVLIAYSAKADVDGLEALARQLAEDARREIVRVSGMDWRFHRVEPKALDSDAARKPSDFLDEASLRMSEGPFDAVWVVTDVGISSRRNRIEAGLASPTSRVMVLSARQLVAAPRGRPSRALDSEPVVRNGAALLLHLLGHLMGLRHVDAVRSPVMRPFVFDEARTSVPRFSAEEERRIRQRVQSLPERELVGGTALDAFIFHVMMALRHPADVAWPLLRNRSLFLALHLPGLATAALAPSFLLVFTAEIWDVGLSIDTSVAIGYAVVTILLASLFLASIQNLFFPRKERKVLTEHLAVANTVVYLSLLLASIGLFVMLTFLMYVLEVWVFPPGLINTWPTLDHDTVTARDMVILAMFIATAGVSTGALAGGFDNRSVIQHLALFDDEP